MDKDRVKGAVNDAAGRVKRQVGEWTGDTSAQVEGTAQQIKANAKGVWHGEGCCARREREYASRSRAE